MPSVIGYYADDIVTVRGSTCEGACHCRDYFSMLDLEGEQDQAWLIPISSKRKDCASDLV